MDGTKALGIYLHIPFCIHKCDYCDFLSVPADKSVKTKYVDSMLEEIKACRSKYDCEMDAYKVKSVYFGGGTPSCIDGGLIGKLMACVREEFVKTDTDADAIEITIEVNPGAVTDEKLSAYRDIGINRLSIGLQSADDNELKALGRIHGVADFLRTYEAARAAGHKNINVDIMTAIPGQTFDSLKHTLDIVTGLKPEHISTYSLMIEEGTPFYDRYNGEDRRLFDEKTEREMYHKTAAILKEYGYDRYEISNFALPGFYSRHNTAYWKRTEYFGFGAGASSFIENIRYKNTRDIEKYIKDPVSKDLFEERVRLNKDDCMEEFMFLGLRMSKGVSEDEFEHKFSTTIRKEYGSVIERFINEGLIEEWERNFRLTKKGIDYGNYVFAGFLH